MVKKNKTPQIQDKRTRKKNQVKEIKRLGQKRESFHNNI